MATYATEGVEWKLSFQKGGAVAYRSSLCLESLRLEVTGSQVRLDLKIERQHSTGPDGSILSFICSNTRLEALRSQTAPLLRPDCGLIRALSYRTRGRVVVQDPITI
jgi:hypothetical protein